MSGRLKPLDRLEGAQRDASSPDHHAALAASAGTGKTHVLTARVLRLLLRGVAPETILCLTFTKAGAAEMAQRIHGRLARWVRLKRAALELDLENLGEVPAPPLLELARSLFARVLEAPGGGLRIQTIHAFAQSLLGSFPAEAGLTPGFRPLEDREQQVLARATLADLLVRAEEGGDLPLIRDVQALSLRFGEAAAEGLLQAAARVPAAMAALGAAQGIEPRLRDAFGLAQGEIEDLIAAECGDDRFDMASLARAAEANAAWGTATGLGFADRIAAWRAADPAARAASLDDLLGVFVTGKGEPRKASSGLLKVAPDYPEYAARLAESCGRLLTMWRTAEWVALAAAGLRAGQAFAGAYAEAKRAQGLVDFDDLIREAEKLLATPGMGDWVRYKLDQQTDHILVDEAQDTNRAQWRIVEALAGEFFASEDWSRRHRTIFTVGDFKQAIFSFQGTDPAEFERARSKFAGSANAFREAKRDEIQKSGGFRIARADELPPAFLDLSMDRSFRSAPPVLEAVDSVIGELGHETIGLPSLPNRHESHNAKLPGSVTLWRPFVAEAEEEDEGEEGWLSDSVRLYARKLARQVKAWIDRPFPVGKERRPLQPQDILILLRSRGELAGLIVARLHAEGVPVAGVDRMTLSAPLVVQDLLAAARFAIQPLDDLNLAGLLVSPLLGWSQDDLYAAAKGREGKALWPWLRAQSQLNLQPLYDMLGHADLATPHEFFERLLSGPLDGRRKLQARLGVEARDPIEELLTSALEFEKNGAPSLARFLDWFARGTVEITRDPSAPRDAVRVMTVHGAKGLEAPVVILADACADPKRMGGGVRFAGLPMGDEGVVPVPRPAKGLEIERLSPIIAAKDERDRQEHWRLLYVAMTRARERLYVGGALGARAKAPPEESWYTAVERGLAALDAGWEEDADWGGAIAHGAVTRDHPQPLQGVLEGSQAITGPDAPDSPPAVAGGAGGGSSLPAWLKQAAPAEERPPRPLAPSSLGEDEAPYPPPGPELRREALRGKLLHRLFERLPDVPAEDRRARAEAWLERSGDAPDPAFRETLIDAACRVIDDPRFADLFSANALAEAPIAATVAGGQVIAGTADRLLITGTRILVADFKTGRRVPERAEEAPVSHLRQMAAYRAALAIIFPGRRIDAALLYTSGPLLLPLADDLLDAYAPVPA